MSLPPIVKKQKLLQKLRKLKIQRDKLESTIEAVEGNLEALAIKMQKIQARHDAKKRQIKAREDKAREEAEKRRKMMKAKMKPSSSRSSSSSSSSSSSLPSSSSSFLVALRDSGLPSKLVTSCYNKMSKMETAVMKNLQNISWEFHEVKYYIKTYGFCHVFCPRGKYYGRSRKITQDNPELQRLTHTYETMCEHLHKWGPLQTVNVKTFVIFENNPRFSTLGNAERRRNHPFFFLKATGKRNGDIAATTKAQSHALLLAKKKELKTWTAQAEKSAKDIMKFIQGRVKAEQTYYDKLHNTAYHSEQLCAAGVSSESRKRGYGLEWLGERGEELRRKLRDFTNDLTEDIKAKNYKYTLPPPPVPESMSDNAIRRFSGESNAEAWSNAFMYRSTYYDLTKTNFDAWAYDGGNKYAGVLNQSKIMESDIDNRRRENDKVRHVAIDKAPIWDPRDIQNPTWWVGG